jgi:hypothetical protein
VAALPPPVVSEILVTAVGEASGWEAAVDALLDATAYHGLVGE